LINSNRSIIWEFFTNLPKLSELIPDIFGKLEAAENKYKIITYKFYNSIRQSQYEISVLKNSCEVHDSKWVFKISIKNENKEEYYPEHNIKIILHEISPNVNLFIIRNIFQDNVNINFLNSLNQNKISILKILKEFFESKKNSNL